MNYPAILQLEDDDNDVLFLQFAFKAVQIPHPLVTVRDGEEAIEYLGGSREAGPSALDAVGLGPLASLPAAYLSAGQRRRLSIARLAAVQRPIWLLDEPTSALDAPSQERLTALMQAHLAGGGIIVAATHGPIGLPGALDLRLGA